MPAKKTTQKKTVNSKKQSTGVQAFLKKAPKASFPASITPMLATLVDKPFEREGWIYEVKWDGYRALAFKNKTSLEIRSRNNKSFDKKFYPVYDAVKRLKLNAVLDGEIVVINDNGVTNFGALQNWRSEADGELLYYLFDILWLEGRDLTGLPLTDRKAILEQLVPKEGIIRFSQSFASAGLDFFNNATEMGLEGIMAKKADSVYQPDVRTKDWLKIKINKRQEVVIGGYTNNEGSSKPFSALLVGVFENGRLNYSGKIGTGFTTETQKQMLAQFKPLVTSKVPFTEEPDVNKPSRFRPNPPHATVTWLKPKLVCEVSFVEMTSDGIMRHPSFEGMRIDKNATAVVLEKATPTKAVVDKKATPKNTKLVTPAGVKTRKTLLNPSEATQVKTVAGKELKFTNLDKVYWPQEGYTKRDMLNFYYLIAPFIVPYLKDRPQSLNRYPNGITGHSFYQKDVTGKAPGWVKQFPYTTSEGEDKNFMVPQDEADLLYMANLGAIEMNPWFSRIQSPDNPDFCVIDLDPDKNTFEQVIEAAQIFKRVLDAVNVPSYCKTSGSTGIHIYIPLAAKYTYDQSQMFARLLVNIVHNEIPGYTSVERIIKNRKGKMYLDFLQNRPGATIAGPYSLRPKPGATVSTPLHWEEVKKGLKMKDFTIKNVPDRLKKEGDLFKPVLGKGINLPATLKKMQSVFSVTI